MNISENLQKSLLIANTISDSTFKSLLENSFAVLTGASEPHNIRSLYNSKPDQIKELYAALLSIIAEFVRNGQSKDQVLQFLTSLNFTTTKLNPLCELYERNRNDIEASLVNIGTHLPHITDVTWKIDYVIKSSNLDESGGPLFRIALQTEQFDNKVEFVNFTCSAQKLQDLVYKLKDAVRHCQRLTNER